MVQSPDGGFVMTYTQWNRDLARLAVATSSDLVHWRKHGPAFEGIPGFTATWSRRLANSISTCR